MTTKINALTIKYEINQNINLLNPGDRSPGVTLFAKHWVYVLVPPPPPPPSLYWILAE